MKMYYSLSEAAEKLGYASGAVIRVYIHQGYMKGTKIGRNWFIHHKELLRRQKQINKRGKHDQIIKGNDQNSG